MFWSSLCSPTWFTIIKLLHSSLYQMQRCSAFGPPMWFTFESDGVHLCPTRKCEKISETTIVMRFTSIYVVVHLPRLCGPLVHKKIEKKTTKTRLTKCTSDNRNHEVHLTLWCNAIFDWSSVVFCQMKSTRRFGCREKQSVRILVNLKLLLNHKEL